MMIIAFLLGVILLCVATFTYLHRPRTARVLHPGNPVSHAEPPRLQLGPRGDGLILPIGLPAAAEFPLRNTTELVAERGATDIVYSWVNGSEEGHLLLKAMRIGRPTAQPDGRDKDIGELKYSLRSVESHMTWHRGGITIVSPGHVPTWLDVTHPRISVVHQDALSDWSAEDERGTFNTNGIEAYIYRVPKWNWTVPSELWQRLKVKAQSERLTDVVEDYREEEARRRTLPADQRSKLKPQPKPPRRPADVEVTDWDIRSHDPNRQLLFHFNDDYLVGRRTTIRDFVNSRGGGNLLFEVARVLRGSRNSYAWNMNTARKMGRTWEAGVYSTHAAIDALLGEKTRYYVKHAPFVYCRRVLEGIGSTFYRRFRGLTERQKFRAPEDLLLPFLHHAIALENPRAVDAALTPFELMQRSGSWSISDHCPRSEGHVTFSEAVFFNIVDNTTTNQQNFEWLLKTPPTFFNVNDAYSQPVVREQLKNFLRTLFPRSSEFESPDAVAEEIAEVTGHAAPTRPEPLTSAKKLHRTAGLVGPKTKTEEHQATEALLHSDVILVATSVPDACAAVRSMEFMALPRRSAGRVFLLVPTNIAIALDSAARYATARRTAQRRGERAPSFSKEETEAAKAGACTGGRDGLVEYGFDLTEVIIVPTASMPKAAVGVIGLTCAAAASHWAEVRKELMTSKSPRSVELREMYQQKGWLGLGSDTTAKMSVPMPFGCSHTDLANSFQSTANGVRATHGHRTLVVAPRNPVFAQLIGARHLTPFPSLGVPAVQHLKNVFRLPLAPRPALSNEALSLSVKTGTSYLTSFPIPSTVYSRCELAF